MKRKLTALFLSAIMTFSSTATIFADDDITVKLNDSNIEFDQAPIVESGRTLVPFRAILEAMNVDVDWDADTKTITCTKGDKVIKLTIGENEMFINDKEVALDVPAKIVNGRTLLPLRAISENLDAEVKWDSETKTIDIKTDNSTAEENSTEEENSNNDNDTNTNTNSNSSEEQSSNNESETVDYDISDKDRINLGITNASSPLIELNILKNIESISFINDYGKLLAKHKKTIKKYTDSPENPKISKDEIDTMLSEIVEFADKYNVEFTYISSIKAYDDVVDIKELNNELLELQSYLNNFYFKRTSPSIGVSDKTKSKVKEIVDEFVSYYKPYYLCTKIITSQKEANELANKAKSAKTQLLEACKNNNPSVELVEMYKLLALYHKFDDTFETFNNNLIESNNPNIDVEGANKLIKEANALIEKIVDMQKSDDRIGYVKSKVDALIEELEDILKRVQDFAEKNGINIEAQIKYSFEKTNNLFYNEL